MNISYACDDLSSRHEVNSGKLSVPGKPSILVAIASYGTGQDHFLKEVVAEFRTLDTKCRIVVLSNIDKSVPGAEVRVGLPTSDSYSLPFAHRRLFAENAENYDLFIYTEDDTLITARNIRAFLQLQSYLDDHEILGFLRSETDANGNRYVVSANHHFRWLADTVVSRGHHRFAQFSNQHSGCFIATRKQLLRAIASGGFTTKPSSGRYGMLETAASQIYTQCSLKRVICLTQIGDFIVPHLANKYHGQMGVSIDDFDAQVKCVLELANSGPATTLFDPETDAPGFRWSKNLYRGPDDALLDLVPASARRILSIGAAYGGDEIELLRRGHEVSAIPLDAIFGEGLRRRGVRLHSVLSAKSADFDVVFAADMLHLVSDPAEWLRVMAELLAADGQIVGSVSNTSSLLWLLKDWQGGRRWARPNFAKRRGHPMSDRRIAHLCRAVQLECAEVVPAAADYPQLSRLPGLLRKKLAKRLLFRVRKKS